MTPSRPLAVSTGDPAGIGADVILTAWANRERHPVPAFYVLGDPDHLARRSRRLGLEIPLSEDISGAFADALPVRPLTNRLTETPGVPEASNAAGIIEAIETAVADTVEGRAGGVVTAPISKKPLYDAGFRHPGHTEYLATLAERHTAAEAMPVMMLAGPELRTVPVTIHIPLAAVIGELTSERIVQTCLIVDRDLRARFGLARPRLAVAGLNPHAGEGGALGTEDEAVIRPAVETLRQRGVEVRGPLPADTMFHARARETHDVAICMYHDQALIPAKTLAFDEAVNVTLGLPFIRTSPDHGTAFEIAGTGKARPDSFRAALRMAAEMARHEREAEPA